MVKTRPLTKSAKIKVIGLGGSGCNAITRMVRENLQGVEFIAMHTDTQALNICEAPQCVQLGTKLLRGLCVKGDHNLGQKAAEQSRKEIKKIVSDSDIVFITTGIGGGTGTGSAPFVAQLAKKNGALTIAVVTKPFSFEGSHRCAVAEDGINKLINNVDLLTVIPNDRMLALCDSKAGVDNAFGMVDEVLNRFVQIFTEIITNPSMINLDLKEVKALMKDGGLTWLSRGRGSGKNWVTDAIEEARTSPLLDVSIEGAKSVLFYVAGGNSLALAEVNKVADVIRRMVDPEANIIYAAGYIPSMEDQVIITLIATNLLASQGLKR